MYREQNQGCVEKKNGIFGVWPSKGAQVLEPAEAWPALLRHCLWHWDLSCTPSSSTLRGAWGGGGWHPP